MSALLAPERPALPRGARQSHRNRPGRPAPVHGPQTADDLLIGVALTTQWMLITGRRLDQLPLLHDLPADQLIDFWADDHDSEPGFPGPS